MRFVTIATLFILLSCITPSFAQQSVARQWNDLILNAIRGDFARPTVHARNLYHTSMLMYDAWAIYETTPRTYLIDHEIQGFECLSPSEIIVPDDAQERRAAQEETMSHALYNMMSIRFINAPEFFDIVIEMRRLMNDLGYDYRNVELDYVNNPTPATLGNFMAQCMRQYGLMDGSNESSNYQNKAYQTVNLPLVVEFSGNPNIQNPNRWQQLTLDVFIDQSGNEILFNTPDFLGPEWGQVIPFALSEEDLTIYQRDNFDYNVFHDPGLPPQITYEDSSYLADEYIWGFSLVTEWSSHLDPSDEVMIDISPATFGNSVALPTKFEDYRNYYKNEGGSQDMGHQVNPNTGLPYEPNMVLRGDYTRVLAEFWADGPDSETPPGHWFVILNEVMDHPEFNRDFKNKGEILDTLEYDVKAYFMLGATMHDAAVTAWGIKGWYDYIRPISAIRYMADRGQSTDPNDMHYDPNGLPLVLDKIELVRESDPLNNAENDHLGKIKVRSWKGPDFISDPATDVAGVDWILAENWNPYQRPSFVTPPFAGYISGHSTFSRSAAEILSDLTGDRFFPGGMGEFEIKKNEFLVFEDGPSEDLILQWATYQDASDQTSLSRIWGGIHPPADDIPGRIIGIEIANDVINKMDNYFNGITTSTSDIIVTEKSFKVFPNPLVIGQNLNIQVKNSEVKLTKISIVDIQGKLVASTQLTKQKQTEGWSLTLNGMVPGYYTVLITTNKGLEAHPLVVGE